MRKFLPVCFVMFTACGADETSDDARLAQFRAAIPSKSQLSARSPQPSGTRMVGDPALYPTAAHDIVAGINGSVSGIIDLMRAIVSLPPTFYNSETEEYVWGPYPNRNDYGTVAAYIAKQPQGADFEYAYALIRGAGNDVATMTPVVWGAATPDPTDEDNGVGVTLWDFEANYAFAQAHDPNAASKAYDRGRFVAIYGRGADAADPEQTFAFVVAVLRAFVPKDEPQKLPADLDYFYGRHVGADAQVDFLNFAVGIDIHEDGINTAAEDVDVHMAFLNEGYGRADVSAVGGDLAPNEAVLGTECWDNSIGRQYLLLERYLDSVPQPPPYVEEGALANCGPDINGTPLFSQSLDALGIPSLADVPADLMAALDEVATHGMPQP